MSLVYIYVALASYNTGYLTLDMNSIENIVDEAANIAIIDGKGRRRLGGSEKMRPGAMTSQAMGAQNRRLHWKEIWNEGTDAVMDIPVGGVCEVLYGPERDDARDNHSSGQSSTLGLVQESQNKTYTHR
jgi:phosphatidylinositol glycan class P protein